MSKKQLRGISRFRLSPYYYDNWVIVGIGVLHSDLMTLTQRESDNCIIIFENLTSIDQIKKSIHHQKLLIEDLNELDPTVIKKIALRVEEADGGFTGGFYKFLSKSKLHIILIPAIDEKDLTDVSKMLDVQLSVHHEVLHLAQEFLPDYLDRDVEHEAEAYFIENIVRQIMNEILSKNFDTILDDLSND